MESRKQVLLIGGTGFIGYHIANVLLAKGYSVNIMSRCIQTTQNKLNYFAGDIDTIEQKKLKALVADMDVVIFAAGADDRTLAKKPAYEFFYKKNVAPVMRLGQALQETGVKHFIVLGSYFSWLSRKKPELKLEDKHPYIKSRTEQLKSALSFATDKLTVTIFELPYVFGVSPNKKTMWSPLIKYANTRFPFLFYTSGGTAAVSVKQVANAVELVLNKKSPSGAYPLSDTNLSWNKLLLSFRKNKPIRIVVIPSFILFPLAIVAKYILKVMNRESGLNPSAFLAIQYTNTFISNEDCLTGFVPNPLLLFNDISTTVENANQ